MTFTNAELGVLLIVISAVLLWPLRIMPKVRSILVFAGIILAGLTSGWLIHLAARLTAMLSHLFSSLVGLAFGASVTGIAVIVALVVLLHDWHPRHQARGRTYWLAVACAVAIVTASTGITALNGLPGQVRATVTQAGG
jgi:hypothetical protein